jgi:hypothetical protein
MIILSDEGKRVFTTSTAGWLLASRLRRLQEHRHFKRNSARERHLVSHHLKTSLTETRERNDRGGKYFENDFNF